MWFLVITSVIVVAATIAVLRFLKYKAHFDKMPGPDDFRWSSGNLHLFKQFDEEGIAVHHEFVKKFPYFIRIWYGPTKPFIVCCHPETVKAVIKNSPPKPQDSAFITSVYNLGKPWIGEGLLLSNGERWKRNRKLLTPAFHFDVLKNYMSVFNSAGDVCVDKLEEVCKEGQSVIVETYMGLQSLDVLLQCAFSYETNCQVKGSEYASCIKDLTHMWMTRFENVLYWNDFIYSFTSHCKKFTKMCKFVHGVADEVIQKRKKALEGNTLQSAKVKDFLDILILARDEEGNGLSDYDIRSEVDTFMFEGHDTTAMGLSFFLYMMALHPEHQEKCYEEVCNVLGDRDTVLWEDLPKLEYLTLCIKESLRMNNSIPMTGRSLDKDMEYQGYFLPKGTEIQISLFLLHNNPLIWEKPSEFDPQRFSPENASKMNAFQFLPFSAGNRNCIGQNFAMYEMKTLLSKVLKRFVVTMDKSKPVKRRYAIAITTETGIHLHFTARKEGKQ